jgi:hypothetical protein
VVARAGRHLVSQVALDLEFKLNSYLEVEALEGHELVGHYPFNLNLMEKTLRWFSHLHPLLNEVFSAW